jgi:hypothetical protein
LSEFFSLAFGSRRGQRTIPSAEDRILLLSLLLSLIIGFGQAHAAPYRYPAYWASYYGGSDREDAFAVVQTADRGFLVGGVTESFGAGIQDVWLVKLDDRGRVQWEKAYGGAQIESLGNILQTAEGGYVVSGSTESYGAGRSNFWLLKLEDDGTIEWQYAYGSDETERANHVEQTSDGGFIAAGVAQEGADRKILILKLDADGALEWHNKYGGSGIERRSESIHQTPDGGYVFTGSSTSFGVVGSAVWVVKLDPSGTIEWQKHYGAGDAEAIELTADGGYILLAEKGDDFWVAKLAEDGAIDWQNTYGGTELDDAQPIHQTRDGGYVLGGSTSSFDLTSEDAWLLKLDPDGNIEWERTWGGSGADEIIAMQQTADSGYVAAGGTDSPGAAGQDILVLRMNEDGAIGCCVAGFRSAPSDATVTTTTVAPTDTTTMALASDVERTTTDAMVTETSAPATRRCSYRVIPPGAVAECLSASPAYTVHSVWMLSLLVLSAAALLAIAFFVVRWIARRPGSQ